MKNVPGRFAKMRPIDYVVLIGAPVAFFLIAVFGLRAIVGEVPATSPVQLIKDGDIKPGDNMDRVRRILGAPKSIDTRDDGSMTFKYTRTIADPELEVEEGIVTFDASGKVVEARVARQAPTPATPTP